MDQDELGGCFVVAVEELGYTGLWSSIKDFLETRAALQNVLLSNKVGQEVLVDNLPIQYVLASDKRLLRLKPFSHSPVTWFRNPYAHVILVSTAEAADYKAGVKNLISKVVADLEREWGGATLACEWIILYIRPFELDVNDRNAKRVFEKLRDDFGRKKRERCVRLDLPGKVYDLHGRRMPALGLEDLEVCLKEAVQASFESRQAAYDEEVKKLVEERLEPAWSFTTLYLVKDSFALMLECAGMVEDALREYCELELCYVEALNRQAVVSPDFGASSEDDDMAQILTASWRTTRRAVLKKNGIPEFSFRQYLFAAQARLLLQLGRLLEVGERGLTFINSMKALLAEKEQQGLVRPFLKEAWTFSACLVLVATISSSLSEPEPAHEEQLATYLHMARSAASMGSIAGSPASPPPILRPMGATPATGGTKHTDWDLGLSVPEVAESSQELPVLGGRAILPNLFVNLRSSAAAEAQQQDTMEKVLYRLLGHTYQLARQQLLQLGAALSFLGPLQPRPNTKVPPALQALLRPSFGPWSDLAAGFHPRSAYAAELARSLQHSASSQQLATACSTPRSDINSLGGTATPVAPATPEPSHRSGLPPPSPSSAPATPDRSAHSKTAAAAATPPSMPSPTPITVPGSTAAATAATAAAPAAPAVPPMNGVAAASVVLRSVSEWRLRAALEGQESFDDLLQSLTSLTIWCFARASHWRSAALLRLEQAATLLQRGALDGGCSTLTHSVARLEGWGLLHGYLLPCLLAAQGEAQHPDLPTSLTKLLTLPPHLLLGSNRSLFRQHLLKAMDTAAVSLDLSASYWRQQQLVVANTVHPTFSRLCGISDDAQPLLVPRPQPCPAWAHPPDPPPSPGPSPTPAPTAPLPTPPGAAHVCVGDRSHMWLELHNQLDVEVELTHVVLVLGLLQPLSPTARLGGLYRQSSGATRVSTARWQEAQDVVCHHITYAPEDGSPPDLSHFPSPPCTIRLPPGRTRLVAATVPTQDGLYTLKHVAASLGGIKLHIPVCRPDAGELGPLTGSQQPLAAAAAGGGQEGALVARQPRQRPEFLQSVLPTTELLSSHVMWGLATKDGSVAEEVVVLEVGAVQPRVQCGLCAMGAQLVSGVQPQWVGLVLVPRHDVLQHLVVRMAARLTTGHSGDRLAGPATSTVDPLGSTPPLLELFTSSQQQAWLVDLQSWQAASAPTPAAPTTSTCTSTSTQPPDGSAAAPPAATPPSPPSSGSSGGVWLTASRGAVELGAAHPVTGPAVLWIPVAATYPHLGVETVKVQRAPGAEPASRHSASIYTDPHVDKARLRACAMSVEVSLEYVCGCPRAHTSMLTLPLQPPFHVQLLPTQLSNSSTVLQVVLQCGALRGVTISAISLAPQVGLQLEADVTSALGLLPLHLDALASAQVTLMLQTGVDGEVASQQYKDEASVLTIQYTLDEESPAEVEPQVVEGPGGHTCWQGPLPRPPSLADASGPLAAPAAGPATRTFQHMFVLDFPAGGQTPECDLQVQLLGPWSGRVGEQVAMTWQVTRLSHGSRHPHSSSSSSSSSNDEMIYFEVAQDSSNWYSVCQGKGMLRLGRHVGSVATVEAVVVPQVAGSCPPPGLNLRGVSISASDAYSQEIFVHGA